MSQPPYALDAARRACVVKAVVEACTRRGWTPHAVHVRDSHVHAVVAAADTAEKVMNALKGYASRRLNENGFDSRDRRRWTRHGSTR
jgi:REP element-mobilizing transposase RayT